MRAEAAPDLDKEARHSLWRAYQLILDCGRREQEQTAGDGDPCPDSSPAADTRASTSGTLHRG